MQQVIANNKTHKAPQHVPKTSRGTLQNMQSYAGYLQTNADKCRLFADKCRPVQIN
jgi:hypothetical protein